MLVPHLGAKAVLEQWCRARQKLRSCAVLCTSFASASAFAFASKRSDSSTSMSASAPACIAAGWDALLFEPGRDAFRALATRYAQQRRVRLAGGAVSHHPQGPRLGSLSTDGW